MLDCGIVLGEENQVVVSAVRNVFDSRLNLPDREALADIGLADPGRKFGLDAGEVDAGHWEVWGLFVLEVIVQLGFLANDVAAVKCNVHLLYFVFLEIEDLEIFLTDVLALHTEESQSLQRLELILVLVDFPQVWPVVLKKLWLEQQIASRVFVFKLQFVLWFYVDLRIQMDNVIE